LEGKCSIDYLEVQKLVNSYKDDKESYIWVPRSGTEHLNQDSSYYVAYVGCISGNVLESNQAYKFPFSIPIKKSDLPSMYLKSMDQDAKPEVTISYVIKASFFINQMPWEVVEDVQIKGCIDIKDLYKLPKEPVVEEDSGQICCWCCVGGKFSASFHLDKIAYVIGDWIKVCIDVDNRTNKSIKFEAKLDQKIEYHSDLLRSKVIKKIKMKSSSIYKNSSKLAKGESDMVYLHLKIPNSSLPSYQFNSNSFSGHSLGVNYKIRVKL